MATPPTSTELPKLTAAWTRFVRVVNVQLPALADRARTARGALPR